VALFNFSQLPPLHHRWQAVPLCTIKARLSIVGLMSFSRYWSEQQCKVFLKDQKFVGHFGYDLHSPPPKNYVEALNDLCTDCVLLKRLNALCDKHLEEMENLREERDNVMKQLENLRAAGPGKKRARLRAAGPGKKRVKLHVNQAAWSQAPALHAPWGS
tara:strand:+ start:52 stop:528 length:477 start_codon:yes stop_codon:yes gene_type:complete